MKEEVIKNEISKGRLEEAILLWKNDETNAGIIDFLCHQEQILSHTEHKYHTGEINFEILFSSG